MNAKESIKTDFVPADVRLMMERIRDSGSEVWLVGGAVRDRLMGRVPKDWDLATNAGPDRIMQLFPRVVPVGIRHGTVRIHTRLRDVEVTSYPESLPKGIVADLGRRDFTVNALALSYPEGELLDPHDGRRDLDGRMLRAVLDAEARLSEDPLRVLRAFRLVCEYGFEIHEDTWRAICSKGSDLAGVAGERIREELFKILMGGHTAECFSLMKESAVFRTILPELNESAEAHAIRAIENCPFRLRVRIAAMLHGLGEEGCPGSPSCRRNAGEAAESAGQAMKRWKMSNRQIRETKNIVSNQLLDEAYEWTDAEVRAFIAGAGAECIEDILDLALACRVSYGRGPYWIEKARILRRRFGEQLENHGAFEIGDLALNGEDILKLTGFKRGPIVGEILRKLHREVLRDPFLNDRKILMDFIRKEYHIEAIRETS